MGKEANVIMLINSGVIKYQGSDHLVIKNPHSIGKLLFPSWVTTTRQGLSGEPVKRILTSLLGLGYEDNAVANKLSW